MGTIDQVAVCINVSLKSENSLSYPFHKKYEISLNCIKTIETYKKYKYLYDPRMKNVLDKKRTSLEITSTDLNEQLNASFRTFDRLLTKTRGLFDMTSCDMWPLEQLLGKSNLDLDSYPTS